MATECVSLSNYVVVQPQNSLFQCYVYNSQIIEFYDTIKTPIKYHVNDEDWKRFEDNFKHIPKKQIKNPLSNPGFSTKRYDGTRNALSLPDGTYYRLLWMIFQDNDRIFIIEKITKSNNSFGTKHISVLTPYTDEIESLLEMDRFNPSKDIKKYFPKCD